MANGSGHIAMRTKAGKGKIVSNTGGSFGSDVLALKAIVQGIRRRCVLDCVKTERTPTYREERQPTELKETFATPVC